MQITITMYNELKCIINFTSALVLSPIYSVICYLVTQNIFHNIQYIISIKIRYIHDVKRCNEDVVNYRRDEALFNEGNVYKSHVLSYIRNVFT